MRHNTWITLAALSLGAGCGDRGEAGTNTGGITGGITTASSTTTDSDSDTGKDIFDLGDDGPTSDSGNSDGGGECDANDLKPTNANLQGIVYAPNMEIPISGALVYLTSTAVDPVPDGVYCAECVKLPCDEHFVLTNPDGSFDLPAVAGPGQKLVVQKGQFLHVVDFNVVEGVNPVPVTQSNLPGVWNPGAGMWIPRIAVYDTDPDKVHNVLAKFGMGLAGANGALIAGSENFTLISDSDQGAFMDDLSEMSKYHIVFVPCAATKFWLGAPTVPPARAQNIRDYVEAGGKWYATDHSNEYIEGPFPSYQDFHAPTMPDIQPAYDVTGTVLDEGLLAWLNALSPALKDIGGGNPTLNALPGVELRLNYSGLDATYEILVPDQDGLDVNVGHHTWVEGPCTSCSDPNAVRPMAVSGQWGCGRMMYSTFENSSTAHEGLNPQELVLLYMILEIGVCHGAPPPPPPPVG